jgi:glutaredoxin
MNEKVIIYGKGGWPHTEKARSAYGKNAKYYDVEADSTKLEEMLKHSKGVRNVPVILEGSKIIVGYGGSWGVWTTGSLPVRPAVTLARIHHAGSSTF